MTSFESNHSAFPHGYCYAFPQGRAAAPSAFSENTFLVELSGPGALQITNQKILNAIGKSGSLPLVTMARCQVLQPEDFQHRLILPDSKLPLDGIRTSHGSGSSKVFINGLRSQQTKLHHLHRLGATYCAIRGNDQNHQLFLCGRSHQPKQQPHAVLCYNSN